MSMSYQEAAARRKKGFISSLTEKLVEGAPIGESVKATISEGTQAKIKGIKEKFDPLNIVKVMTGGSKLAPALLGRAVGRKQEDIERFAGKSKKSYDVAGTGTSTKISSLESENQILDSLLKIYNFLQTSREQDIKYKEKNDALKEGIELNKKRRHEELLKALEGVGHPTATPIKEKDDKGGLFGFISGMINDAISGVMSMVNNIKNFVEGIIGAFSVGGLLKDAFKILSSLGKFLLFNPLGLAITAGVGIGSALLTLIARDKDPESTNKGIQNAGKADGGMAEAIMESSRDYNELSPEEKKLEKNRIERLNAALKDAPLLTRLYQKDVPQYLKQKNYSDEQIKELITPIQDRKKEVEGAKAPSPEKPTPKATQSSSAEPTAAPEVTVPATASLNEKTKEFNEINLPQPSPATVNTEVVNNTNMIAERKMVPVGPVPAVRNTEPTFSDMIFNSTRVV